MSWRRRAVVDAELKHVERPACRPATGAEVEEGGEEVGAEMELADITEKVARTVLIAGTEGGQQQI